MTDDDFTPKRKSFGRWALGITGTLFISLIGNLLWESLRAPVNAALANIAVVVNGVTGSYLDKLYGPIGSAHVAEVGFLPFKVFQTAIIVLNIVGIPVLFHISKALRELEEGGSPAYVPPIPERFRLFWSKPGILFGAFLALINIVMYSNGLIEANHRENTITWVERSIEIIHPKLTAEEFLQLRAQYRSVENARGLYDLYSQIQAYAGRSSIVLPPYHPVGYSQAQPTTATKK